MAAGRRPKPTALKILEGNPGKRALNKSEPMPRGEAKCPPHLDKGAKQEWKRISQELEECGLLTSVDRAGLAAYCAAYSRWSEAEKRIQEFGLVIKSPKSGFPIPNPYVGIANSSLNQMRKYLVEFGMTPASRSRIHVDPSTQHEDPFEAFMSGIGANDITQPSPTGDSDL